LPLPRRVSAGDTVEIDAPTLRGLGVLTSGSGRDGSLLSVMDRTVTAPGARLLVRQLSAPLTDPATIGRRLAMVRCFVGNPGLRADCRDVLGGMPDIPRRRRFSERVCRSCSRQSACGRPGQAHRGLVHG